MSDLNNPSGRVAICIPTFRRPNGLEKCLRSVESQRSSRPIRVIVADNDAQFAEGASVCRRLIASGFRLPLIAISVQKRGIAQARNALIKEALRDEETAFIAMIDDDEWADPDWITNMLRAQRSNMCDIVGGPVIRAFEIPVPAHIARANKPDYRRIADGPIDFVDATSNILFAAHLFREMIEPWFDPRFGLLGGEDKDILLRFKAELKRFGWASDAIVWEWFPASRCTSEWMFKRAYRAGNTDILLFLKHRENLRRKGSTGIATELLKTVAVFVLATTHLFFFWDSAKRFEGLRLLYRAAGKVAGFFGKEHLEYLVVHGN